MDFKLYCEVIVNNKSKATDRFFTYVIPQNLIDKIKIGSKVIVPFGKGNNFLEGFVFDIKNHTSIKDLKSIIAVVDDPITLSEEQISLCKWLKDNYLCTYFDAIQCIVPPGSKLNRKIVYSLDFELYEKYKREKDLKEDEKTILDFFIKNNKADELQSNLSKLLIMNPELDKPLKRLINKGIIKKEFKFYRQVKVQYKRIIKINITEEEYHQRIKNTLSRAPKQKKVVEKLLTIKECELKEFIKEEQVSLPTIKSLVDKKIIELLTIEDYRLPYVNSNPNSIDDIELGKEQNIALSTILDSIEKNSNKKFLLHGVTGSGKTEIYIKLTEKMINLNKQVILLVPEISLTTQIVKRFTSKFKDNIAILHSKLTLSERYDEWRRIKNNEVSIVIGARSAVFAPFDNLGLIIIDEEHESSYKSDTHPKYHALEVAEYRIEKSNGVLLLGSATPSIVSYYKANKGEYQLLELNERYNRKPLPSVEIIDMRKELEAGNNTILSRKLYQNIKKTLEDEKQVILFLNRRGYSTFISCRSCGYVIKCKNCDISLTYHQREKVGKCHYCGYAIKIPSTCPNCNSKKIRYFGTGTEKVESFIKEVFPQSKVRRIDLDTVKEKGKLEDLINDFEEKRFDILIGTQMIAKGLDFPFVSLVGVLSADISLNIPSYQSNERTFQLLTQVAGRAGRHNFSGKVIIQTYSPENYAVKASKNHDYKGFYEKEIKLRDEFLYPPFCNIANIIVYGTDERSVIKSSSNLYYQIKNFIKDFKINILGPNPAVYNKVKGNYRWQILLKYHDVDREIIKDIIYNICDKNRNKLIARNVNITYDIKSQDVL